MNLAAKIHKKQQKTQLLSKFFLKSVNYVKGMATVHTDKEKKECPSILSRSTPSYFLNILKAISNQLVQAQALLDSLDLLLCSLGATVVAASAFE